MTNDRTIGSEMRAISLHQPWATAVAINLKRWETRSWDTTHLGPLAIHAAKRKSGLQRRIFEEWLKNDVISIYFRVAGLLDFDSLPFGKIIAVSNVSVCCSTDFLDPDPTELLLGDFSPGRFGWRLDEPRCLKVPIPFIGRQRFFHVPLNLFET